jgi:N-acetylmuramoyl-L-alanine amidase
MKLIIIDPGHGGPDPGAIGRRLGLKEAHIAVMVATRMHQLIIQAGCEAVMTHTGAGMSLAERCDFANSIQSGGLERVFCSVHCNSAENEQASGFEVFTSKGETKADLYATSVFASIATTYPQLRQRVDYDDGDPDKEADFFVLRNTVMPAILVEMAFISNYIEEILLADHGFQMRYAEAIVSGLLKVL